MKNMMRKFPWETPDFLTSRWSYEEHKPQLSTDLMKESADAPAKGLAQIAPLIGLDKTPTNFGTEYPHFGTDAAISAIQSLPNAVKDYQNAPVLAADRQAQLAKDATILQQQKDALDYLDGLHNPVDENGKPLPSRDQYVTSISNGR